MFHKYGKKSASLHTRPLKDLTRILPSETLLAEEKRTGLLKQIRDASVLEDARFDSLCMTVLDNLISHCQRLPETSNSYYSQPGGLLDHALNRTEAALTLFKQYMILDDTEAYSEEQKLWQYALFSAAILQGIGKLQIDFQVELYDDNGQFLKQWNPLVEGLALTGSHYSWSFQNEPDVEFRKRLNILMARALMPTSGFAWIVSNPQVLAVWLALLNEDFYSAGTLGAILIRADALAIQRYFNLYHARNYGARGSRYGGRAGTFAGKTPDIRDLEQQIGIEFIQWLTKSLADGQIKMNKPPLLMVPGGMLMLPETIDWFLNSNPEYRSLQVQKAVLALGLHQTSADGNIISRFEQNNTKEMHSGILIRDWAVIMPTTEVKMLDPNTGEETAVTPTELINLAKFNNYFTGPQQSSLQQNALQGVNSKGHWQVIPVMQSPEHSWSPGMVTGA